MKILVLNGSPKRDKSDTMHITRAFLDGMNEAACQEDHIIHVIDKHVSTNTSNTVPDAFPVCETAAPASTMTICGKFWRKS